MISYEEAGRVLDEAVDELPTEIFRELNGGVNLVRRQERDENGLLVMGTYNVNQMGRYVEIYYGSFRAKYPDAEPDKCARELVRTLASIFKVRIELRQIYERDDTKMRGALAACGRPCCCTTHLPDFEKVSIKMAKIQGLSLNPQKISGVCGRLLCCLKYENDYYSEVYKKMPKVGSKVHTADGDGVVESNDLIKQTSRVRVLTKDGSYDVKTYRLDELRTTARQTEPDDSAEADAPEA